MPPRKSPNPTEQRWAPKFWQDFHLTILPWQESTALEPIRQLLNAPVADQIERTRMWRDAKIAELSSLSVTSALVASALSSSLSWNALGDLFPAVKGLFVGSLIIVLASISVANQQSTVLHRLSSNNSGMEKLRSSLGRLTGQHWEPRRLQVLIWQAPAMLLIISLFLFGLGLNLQVWLYYAKYQSDVVVVILSTLALGFASIYYVMSYVGLSVAML